MRIINVSQNSPEWLSARCGIPTSSNFDCIINLDGKRSKQREKYLYRLAGEIITGKPEETYQNGAMLRGKEMEAEARDLYRLLTGEIVEETGLCIHDEIKVGASPDGLVGEKGLLEIKCPLMATQVGYLLANELPSEYFQQVQGQLFITGRKWCDFLSYYPAMKPLIVRVEPDKVFHKALESELTAFCADLEDIVKKIR